MPEEWGGDTIFVNVSALTGEGIDQLLESIALQSEVLELKANPKRPASGTVLEALLDRGRGPVARVLVQDGTLRVGDFVLAGAGFGKVRAMTNEHGKQVQEAGPSTPVEILGLNEVPNAGDRMDAVKDPKKAQEIAESRKGKMAKSLIPATAKVSLEELSKRIAESGQQELRVIIKGDVQGSVEAARRRAREALDREGAPLDHPRGRRRDHRGRRQPRHRVEGDHHRLQRAPGRQGERRSPKRTRSRSASTRSSTTRSKT